MTTAAPLRNPGLETGTIDVTILMPCLNEIETLPACVQMAKEAVERFAEIGMAAEILVSDNGSTDGSVELAESLGCRLVHCPRRGYGSALEHGCREARGRYIVMGDSDASYDFRQGVEMVRKLDEGYDLCMGSRFRGEIKPGAMPWKNRYIGNPALTGILNLFYRSGLSDAHCGLRAIRREAFERLGLESRGMEFASEMVVKAALLGLKRTEVPVTLSPDGRSRPPHLRPWRDGWRHLKFLLTLSPLWLYFIPAAVLMLLSAGIFAALLNTPPGEVFRMGRFWVGDHWLILAGGFFTIGYQALLMGLAALTYTVERGFRRPTFFTRKLDRWIQVETLIALGLIYAIVAVLIGAYVLFGWSSHNYGSLSKIREMTAATTLLVASFQNLFGGFLIAMLRSDDAA
jgi:glycosyltransferase involved in cell wall biosynthesis